MEFMNGTRYLTDDVMLNVSNMDFEVPKVNSLYRRNDEDDEFVTRSNTNDHSVHLILKSFL